MEDGVYLGRVLHEVVYGTLNLSEAVMLYERGRMPRAWLKQQVSFMMGAAYMYEDEPRGRLRNESSAPSVPRSDRPHSAATTDGQASGANSTYSQAPALNPRTRKSVIDKTDGVTGPDANLRSWNLWGAPDTVSSIWAYDADADADYQILKYLQEERSIIDPHVSIHDALAVIAKDDFAELSIRRGLHQESSRNGRLGIYQRTRLAVSRRADYRQIVII